MFNFQALRHPDIKVFVILMSVVTGLGNLFICCYFGQLATEQFLKYADCSFDSNWTELPIKLQLYLKIIIENAQIPLYYHGFKMIDLSFGTLTKV